ncbi:MAG: cytochrome c oxidase subunit 3 [bacterium]
MQVTETAVARPEWGGGVSPFDVNWGKFMMWTFLTADAFTFGGFLASYVFARLAAPTWPPHHEILNLNFVGVMTFLLITSSATMAAAVHAAKEGDSGRTTRYLLLTILGGVTFLGMQAYEWTHFIQEGARPWTNPWGVVAFSAFFFLVTGFHGSHVLSGVLYLLVVLRRTVRDFARVAAQPPEGPRSHVLETAAARVENAGLYWHFVDLVWVFVFALMYVI